MNTTDSKTGGRRLLRCLGAILFMGLLAILLSTFFFGSRDGRSDPPDIELTGLDVGVANEIQDARKRIEKSPRSAEAWGELGIILVARQMEPQAHICFQRAHELDPKEFLWPYLHGVSLAVSNPPQAVVRLRTAIALRTDVTVAHSRLGELLLELNDLDGARNHLDVALQQKPNDLHALIARARLALVQNEIALGQRLADKAEQLAPQVRDVHEVQAQLHQRSGDRQAAKRALELASKLPIAPLPYDDPYISRVLALRRDTQQGLKKGRELLASQQFNEAIEVLRDAYRDDPTDPMLPCELARAYAQINRFDVAHAVLEHAEDQHPASAQVRLQRGVLYYLQSQYKPAASYFSQAVDRKPDYVAANYYLAKSLEKLERTEEAVAAFRVAVQLQPNHAEAHADLGRLLLEQDQPDAAIAHLTTALQLNPNNEQVRTLHARASSASESPAEKSKPPDSP